MEIFTEKELEVLNLLMKGYTNQQIGEMIHISIHTVKVYVTSIMRKLNAKNRAHIVYIIFTENILTI